jgi:hypothetical protein
MTSAVEMVRMVRDGQVTSVQLVTACLDKIEAENDQLKAWAHIDREAALARAGEDGLHPFNWPVYGRPAWRAGRGKGYCRYACLSN